MGRNRWLSLAVAIVGVCNVVIVGQWYFLNRFVVYSAESGATTSPLARGVRRIKAKLQSGQIRVTPDTEYHAIKNIVDVAVTSLDDSSRQSELQLTTSRVMLQKTVAVVVLQFAIALAGVIVSRNRTHG